MAYEVLKTIGGREYRYQVESYRDPDTGKVRNRWTYIGKATDAHPTPKRRPTAAKTRERIIAAFLALLERSSWEAVTPSAIAAEAGIAPGTFYRHFHDRNALLDLCTQDANVALEARLSQLLVVAGSLNAERQRLRAWVVDFMRRPTAPLGLMRIWSALPQPQLRQARRAKRIGAFARYIATLRERGYAAGVGPVRPLAIALTFEVEALARRTTLEHDLLSHDEYAAVSETFDRLLFWLPPSDVEPAARMGTLPLR